MHSLVRSKRAALAAASATFLVAAGAPAAAAQMTPGTPTPGVTPFIAFVPLTGDQLWAVSGVEFTIAPLPGTVSKPVHATYSLNYLQQRGYVDFGQGKITVPVFGLYPNQHNTITVKVDFQDGTNDTMPIDFKTNNYQDPNRIYDRPNVVRRRGASDALGFDFFYMKSQLGSPVIVDSDGQLRWEVPNVPGTMSSTFTNNGFVVAASQSLQLYRAELDGTVSQASTLQSWDGTNFSHSIDNGKYGLAGELDVQQGSQTELRSTATEFDPTSGHDWHEWNLDQIISDYMRSHGDDPTKFVRPQTDWFHMNMVFYDASDDSLVVSSRENFVMKLDYGSGSIKWIFGDPTKYWHTFASLRNISLTLEGGGLVPIGQHSTTIAPDGNLLLFNNGTPSFNEPAGAPAGSKRKYSAVSSYVVDEFHRTVQQAWSFDYGQALRSPLCSSARQVSDGSVLVDYAQADNKQHARLVGLNPGHQVVFDYAYANPGGCNTSWNAQPIALDSMTFQ